MGQPMPLEEATGNCYEVAANLVLDGAIGPNAVLVHAQVQHPHNGTFHGHAWVEDKGICHDRANGFCEAIPVPIYYQLGRVKEVKIYTLAETLHNLMHYEHYGPWEDNNE